MTLPVVNNIAVIVTGVAIFILGGLWYSPLLFAKRWVALIGKTEEELKANAGNMPVSYLLVFLCGLITAWVMALVVGNFAPSGAVDGAKIGALCWLPPRAPRPRRPRVIPAIRSGSRRADPYHPSRAPERQHLTCASM